MVSYNRILDVIEDYTTKCSITLKGVREQISGFIQDITDNQEDYDLLMDTIPHFYRDYWNKKIENMSCYLKDYKQTEFSNYTNTGDDISVDMPPIVRTLLSNDLFIDEGIRMAIHNHPSGTSFQSMGDYMTQATYTTKYNITVSDDGITISKLDANLYEVDPLDVMIGMAGFEEGRNQYFYNNQEQYGIDKIKDNVQKGKMTEDEGQEALNKIFSQYINDNIDSETDRVNDMFSYQNIPISVYHMDIKKTYEMEA